ncbi:MAG: hypothetical protein AAF676_12695 [Pseudomonadota bacterium]
MAKARDRLASYLYADDDGRIFEARVPDAEATELADYFLVFTDIALSPSGELFGNTRDGLYRLDLESGGAQLVRILDGPLQANGLAFDAAGRLYISYGESRTVEILEHDSNDDEINVVDSFQIPGSGVGNASAGDMHIVGDTLYFAARDRSLRTVDLETGEQVASVDHGLPALFGLHQHRGQLYGMSGASLYRIDVDTGAAELVASLTSAQPILGAATLPDGVQRATGGGPVEAFFAGAEVVGRKGGDRLIAHEDGARLDGRGGGDRLLGKGGDDRMDGGGGKDFLRGRGGADRLEGDGGEDRLIGDGGRDVLDGGRGADRLTGGAGRDRFEFGRKAGRDVVTDWRDGEDKLSIEAGAKRFGDLEFTERRKFVDVDFGQGVARLMGAELDDLGRSDFVFA